MKDQRGFTLIELIISIAILAILVVAVFSMFDTGIINIVRAGDRTDTVLEKRAIIDEEISNYDGTDNIPDDDINVVIYNTDGVGEFRNTVIEGKQLTIETDPDSPDITITTFVPNWD